MKVSLSKILGKIRYNMSKLIIQHIERSKDKIHKTLSYAEKYASIQHTLDKILCAFLTTYKSIYLNTSLRIIKHQTFKISSRRRMFNTNSNHEFIP